MKTMLFTQILFNSKSTIFSSSRARSLVYFCFIFIMFACSQRKVTSPSDSFEQKKEVVSSKPIKLTKPGNKIKPSKTTTTTNIEKRLQPSDNIDFNNKRRREKEKRLSLPCWLEKLPQQCGLNPSFGYLTASVIQNSKQEKLSEQLQRDLLIMLKGVYAHKFRVKAEAKIKKSEYCQLEEGKEICQSEFQEKGHQLISVNLFNREICLQRVFWRIVTDSQWELIGLGRYSQRNHRIRIRNFDVSLPTERFELEKVFCNKFQ